MFQTHDLKHGKMAKVEVGAIFFMSLVNLKCAQTNLPILSILVLGKSDISGSEMNL